MAEITKRETRNRGERRTVVPASLAPRPAPSTAPTSAPARPPKRKSPEPLPAPEPPQTRDPRHLPSSRTRPQQDESPSQLRSIAESGVLAASLKQSMERWREGGCFEKYWVKNPAKKVHKEANFQNPPTQTMVRLGMASLTIEPHSFEIALYSIRPVMPRPPPKPASTIPQIPPYKMPTKLLPAFPPLSAPTETKAAPAPDATMTSNQQVNPVSMQRPLMNTQPVSANQTTTNQPSSQATRPVPTPPSRQSSSSSKGEPSNSNPVIKELASRAATDEKLKTLMTVVAANTASKAQLEEFQVHINQINAMLRKQAAADKNPPKSSNQGNAPNAVRRDSQNQPQPVWTKPLTPISKQEDGVQAKQTYMSTNQQFTNASQPSGICFEIINGTGDRYLIPRKSLIEFREGTRLAVLSFLVHLRGTNANGGFYEDNKEYCELITFKLQADRTGILDSLRRAVDPPEVVVRHMQEWLGKMAIAEKAWLVLQMERDEEDVPVRPQATASRITEDIKTDYEAPNSLFPLKRMVVAGRC